MEIIEGRFSSAARLAAGQRPRGVSRREGHGIMAWAAGVFACFAVLFQAQNLPAGGLILWAADTALALCAFVAARFAAQVRGVHPRGHERAYRLAAAWMVVTSLAGGGLWMRHPHGASAGVTTAVALVAALPLLLVGRRLATTAR